MLVNWLRSARLLLMPRLLIDLENETMADPKNDPASEQKTSHTKPSGCACVSDPFAALPPELRPKSKSTMGGLRKVTCPGCGLAYWTNRATDLCVDCEKKGVRLPRTDATQEE
jgi:hypothetical protein